MPKCIDDPSRSFTGKEPSPKGRGHCAHTRDVGSSAKGRDGKMWTVVEDRIGRRSWRKSASARKANSKARSATSTASSKARSATSARDRPALTYDMRSNKFSDGSALSWSCRKGRQTKKGSLMSNVDVYDEDSGTFKRPSPAHWNATFGTPRAKGATVRMWSSDKACPAETVRVKAPVTIRTVMSAMSRWYGRAASAKQLRESYASNSWAFDTFAEFKRHIKTVGDMQGDHLFFEGFSGTPSKIIVSGFGS